MPLLDPFRDTDLPFSIIHTYRISTLSRTIYIFLIVFAAAGLILLPFVRIPVRIESRGIFNLHHKWSEVDISQWNMSKIKASHKPFQSLTEAPTGGELIAYCFIKPSQIGMIATGQSVNIKIDGFDEEIWGTLRGSVVAKSADITMSDDGPVFKVMCILNKNHFELNGVKTYLKQEMQFTAIFNLGTQRLVEIAGFSKSGIYDSAHLTTSFHGHKG